MNERADLVELLVGAGADLTAPQSTPRNPDMDGDTAVDVASKSGQKRIVALLQKASARSEHA